MDLLRIVPAFIVWWADRNPGNTRVENADQAGEVFKTVYAIDRHTRTGVSVWSAAIKVAGEDRKTITEVRTAVELFADFVEQSGWCGTCLQPTDETTSGCCEKGN